jgi:hypothetical protein
MSGSAGANLPVAITVTGAQQAERAITRVGQAGAAAANSIGLNMTRATGRVSAFVAQVTRGSTALAAFGSQGPGFLAAFGPAGVVAGAALALGALVTQFFSASRATEELREAQALLARNMDISNGFFETQQQAAERLERTNRDNATTATAAAMAIQTQAQAVRALRLAELEATMEQVRLARELGGENTNLPRAVQRRVVEFERLRAEIADGAAAVAELDQRMNDLRSGRPSGRQVDQAARDAARGGRAGPAAATDDERRLAVQQAINAARQEAIVSLDAYNERQNLADAGIEGAAALLRVYERDMQTLNVALNNGIITEAEFGDAVERTSLQLGEQIEALQQRGQAASNVGREMGRAFSSAFEGMIAQGRRFSDVLKSLAEDLARMVIRNTITTPLSNALSSALGNINFGSLFGGGGTAAPPIAGKRAEGGPVFAGGAYLVGERGPELFTPGTAGGITPNAGGITINQSFAVDARGADQGVIPRLRQEMVAIARAANSELLDAIQRGGSTARIVGRRA